MHGQSKKLRKFTASKSYLVILVGKLKATLSQIYPHWNWNSKLNTKLRLEFQFECGFKLEFQVELLIRWESAWLIRVGSPGSSSKEWELMLAQPRSGRHLAILLPSIGSQGENVANWALHWHCLTKAFVGHSWEIAHISGSFIEFFLLDHSMHNKCLSDLFSKNE